MNLRLLSCVVVAVLSASNLMRAEVPVVGPEPAGAAAEQARPDEGAAAGAGVADAAQPAEPEKPAIAPPRSIYDQAFDRVLDKAENGWLEDPLKHLEGDMSHVVGELTAFKTDEPVQQVQGKVTSRLDTLIKMLEKECNSGGGGGGGGKPLGRSILAKGPGGQGEMHDPKAGDKQWANLPPKQREQILQSRTEGFPPGFESLLQSYYQRLAQEQVGGDEDGGSQPVTPPTDDDAAPADKDAATGETPEASAAQEAK